MSNKLSVYSVIIKLKYNIVASVILVIQLASLGLIYKNFGASNISDVLMVSLSVVGAIQLVQIMPIDQFMVYFHKSKSHIEETNFWQYSLTFGMVIGFISIIAAELMIQAISVMTDSVVWSKYKDVADILKYSLVFYPILFLNDKLLNSKQFIVASYMLSSVTHLFMFASLLIIVLTKSYSGEAVAWGYTVGVCFGAIFSTFFISVKFNMQVNFNISYKDRWRFHSRSLQMRLGHNLVAVFFPVITNYYLANMSAGVASLFHYAYRGVIAVYSISAGPPFKLYMAKISKLWAEDDLSNSRIIGKEFAKNSMFIYLFVIGLAYGVIYAIENFKLISGGLAEFKISEFKNIFLLIAFWHAIILYESRYVGILIASDSSKEFMCVNAIFVIIYMLVAILFFRNGGVYVICIGATFAQVINTFLYYSIAKRKFKLVF